MSNPTVSETKAPASMGCGILGRYPILAVVSFAGAGVGLGIGLSYWEPENEDTKSTLLQWLGLFGDMFIRALKAVVLPLIFVNVAVSVVDMMKLGRASSVGVKTIVLYTLTTLIASTIGLISIVAFRGFFTQGEFDEGSKAFVSLGCTAPDTLLTEMADGSLMCLPDANETSPFSQFEIIDVSASFARSDGGGPANDLSMSDTVYQGVFEKLITDNIFFAFVDGNFAAVVVFAIVFGIALGQVMLETADSVLEFTVPFFHELSKVLLRMINWIIACTPFAVLSLIANALGSQDDLSGAFANVGYLVAACLVGFIAHFIITDICFFWVASGMNPISYLKFIIPAQTTALACASSAATLPVTMECVKATGIVPDDIRNFVLPLGATINMDGSAIYFPCACVWLAVLNGVEVNAGHMILLIILSTIGSAGAAPVPSSGLVLVITAYNTVFGTTGTPNGFEFVVAIDFFLDRCITALNITGDSVVAGIIAARTPWTEDITTKGETGGDEEEEVLPESDEKAV